MPLVNWESPCVPLLTLWKHGEKNIRNGNSVKQFFRPFPDHQYQTVRTTIFPICFTEALEVHNLPLAQELNRFADIGFFNQAEDIVVGGAGFLFCDTFINTNNEGG